MDNENNNNDTEQAKFFKDILTEGQTNKKDESVWSKEKVKKVDNKKELPLRQFGEFFIITAILNLIVMVVVKLFMENTLNKIYYHDNTALNIIHLYYFLSIVIFLLSIIIPYIFFRKYIKRKNETEGLKFLDIFAFGLISIQLSMFFSMFSIFAITNISILFTGITVYYILIIGLFMFIVGRNINDKLLCGISAGFIGLIIIFNITWCLWYQYQPYTACSIINAKNDLLIPTEIVKYYPYAGQIFLGIYLFFKRNKHNTEMQPLELASQIEE